MQLDKYLMSWFLSFVYSLTIDTIKEQIHTMNHTLLSFLSSLPWTTTAVCILDCLSQLPFRLPDDLHEAFYGWIDNAISTDPFALHRARSWLDTLQVMSSMWQ